MIDGIETGGTGGVSKPKATSHVEGQLTKLSNQIERAVGLQSDTEKRIATILRPIEGEIKGKPEDHIQEILVGLADTLRTFVKALSDVNDKTESVLDRTEL